MRILILLICSLPVSGALWAERKVRGVVGRAITIHCHYDAGYKSYIKYWCHGTMRQCKVLAQTNWQNGRFSITDNKSQTTFVVTVDDLRPADAGWYSCGIEKAGLDPVFSVEIQASYESVSVPVLRFLSPSNVSCSVGSRVGADCSRTTTDDGEQIVSEEILDEKDNKDVTNGCDQNIVDECDQDASPPDHSGKDTNDMKQSGADTNFYKEKTGPEAPPMASVAIAEHKVDSTNTDVKAEEKVTKTADVVATDLTHISDVQGRVTSLNVLEAEEKQSTPGKYWIVTEPEVTFNPISNLSSLK
ncbi:hypothetical protein scyTo_0002163 [Scyliorhinus torazame]|uniref:Immunoglobulin V-set domain-containing protein n=1 Tax=Scyliorhinus torazame TaxID=75743 RepID=A0A401PI29_SCYTO|nr:hypothetical protein [Scyliorhinus torazame]